MPTTKRERQRINRQQARERRLREAKRAKLQRNVIRFGSVAVAVIAVGFLLSLGDRNEEAPTTTAAAPATTVPVTTVPVTTIGSTTTTPAGTTGAGATGDPVATVEYEALRALPVACGGTLPPPATAMSFPSAQDQGVDTAADPRARLMTSCGEIVINLDPDAAPNTVNSFVFLARSGYYDGTVSHRIVPGFVYQAGDPTARGDGGPGYQYADELPASDFVYTRGTVAMANSGPNTNGSQFFIVFQDSQLPASYTVFGTVESGLEVLDAIEAVPQVDQQPQEGVFIESIVIE